MVLARKLLIAICIVLELDNILCMCQRLLNECHIEAKYIYTLSLIICCKECYISESSIIVKVNKKKYIFLLVEIVNLC